jgi:hypothetical protein
LQDERLIKHEREHARQIAQYGVIGFYAKYLWFTLRHGYRNNPLEVSARRAEKLA